MEFLCRPGTAQGIANGEQGINVLLRDISKTLFPNNPVNVPVIK